VQDEANEATDLGSLGSGIFSLARLDGPNHVEGLHKIRVFAQTMINRPDRANGARSSAVSLRASASLPN
jgi:hypothetical protein